ncbi:hypothetical protein ACFV6E_30585 [Streptomyces sp. NPDC059785]|uniref:hypothetical protein n=1 Tax=unclassified Streptomyces TaxID=2593676 RepID=UPI003654F218
MRRPAAISAAGRRHRPGTRWGADRPAAAGAATHEGPARRAPGRAEARAEAARFTRSLGRLTDTRREEVEARYTEEHLALTRRSWERTARRGGELRAEYEAAYRALRRRLCTAPALSTVPAAAGRRRAAPVGRPVLNARAGGRRQPVFTVAVTAPVSRSSP